MIKTVETLEKWNHPISEKAYRTVLITYKSGVKVENAITEKEFQELSQRGLMKLSIEGDKTFIGIHTDCYNKKLELERAKGDYFSHWDIRDSRDKKN